MAARRPEGGRPHPLELVFASAELSPLVQSGGLGDAVAGLASALAQRGHRVRCLLPAWGRILASPRAPALRPGAEARVALPEGELRGRWLELRQGLLAVELLQLGDLFEGEPLYDGDDDARRFVAFSRAVAARVAERVPDVFVAHDWHAALAVCAFRTLYGHGPRRAVATLQVVHNNAHVGRFPGDAMRLTGLPWELFAPDALEFHGDLCLLKGGLAFADRIVAVSPTYAEELRREPFGAGLEGLYSFRERRLSGIANGIDTRRYDPARDAALPARFDAEHLEGRQACRQGLLEELGLEAPKRGRLLAAVGRLAHQKGWDVIADALPGLLEQGSSLALLGEGDPELAARLQRAAEANPSRVALRLGWDDALARRLYAGADCVLVPSRFEPCGLVQLLAQRYGALPVAHAVGGLRDTIRDGSTGILFEPLDPKVLADAVERAAALLRRRGRSAVLRTLLRTDVSWAGPAARWEQLLQQAAAEAAAQV